MKPELTTPREKEVIEFIRKFWDEKKYAPTNREIMEALALKSENSIRKIITSLSRKGIIGKGEKRSQRTIFLKNLSARERTAV